MPANPNESPQPDHTALVLNVLADFRREVREDIADMRESVADVRNITSEVKGELMQHEMTLQQVLKQQLETNGNVRRHDGELRDIREGHIRDDAIAAGRKAERDRMYAVARLATKPVTWAVGGLLGAVGYIVKDRAG